METSHPPFPVDRQCLVALNALYAISISTKAFDDCGDPAKPAGITATDALLVLRTAVGTTSCLVCTCDVDASGSIVASDALAVLRHAVGQNVDLTCQACC